MTLESIFYQNSDCQKVSLIAGPGVRVWVYGGHKAVDSASLTEVRLRATNVMIL